MTTIKTYDEMMSLPTGAAFSVALPKSLSWKELHGFFYRTASREVTLTMRSGEKIVGTMSESPGYFACGTKAGPKVWLRIPGRKTRKGVDIREVRHLKGFKAPSLAESMEAFLTLHASNPSEEQVVEARRIASLI